MKLVNVLRTVALACVLVATPALAGEHHARDAISITHGVATGDVTSHSAVIWSRGSGEGYMHVQVHGPRHGANVYAVPVAAEDDFTGKVIIDGLRPAQDYTYTVWFSEQRHAGRAREGATGRFHTAPEDNTYRPVTFAWGGDVAGQNVCRDIDEGFPIFNAVNSLRPDFFIGLGDMIYADGTCEATGRYGNTQVPGDFIPSADLDNYWAHWKYNREDEAFRELLGNTAYVAIWDDHEVVNDFGPLHDTRNTAPYTPGEHLLPLGLQAFLDYNPVAESGLTPDRLYRSLRWGKHLELIVLDNRQYRDANLEEDDDTLVKTMLGREQLTWLKDTLRSSDATWKVIVSSVPMSIPTGFPPQNGRDGWANYDQEKGFERELLEILGFLQEQDERNVVFITTDVHFAEVFRYTPFAEDPGFQVHEFVTGPMNAGLFPNRDFDVTLSPESLFFYGPASSDAVTTYEQARRWMNFGAATIDAQGNLTLSVIDVDGNPVYTTELMPQ